MLRLEPAGLERAGHKAPAPHSIVNAEKMSWRPQLQGRTPWNKGLKLSDETRAKMSAARLNKMHLKSTRKKMSQSHLGITHTPVRQGATEMKLPECGLTR